MTSDTELKAAVEQALDAIRTDDDERYGNVVNGTVDDCEKAIIALLSALPSLQRGADWRPIIECPTDGVERWLRLPDGSEVRGCFINPPGRWRVWTAAFEMPGIAPKPRGGVQNPAMPYTTQVYRNLPEGLFPTHFKFDASPHAPASVGADELRDLIAGAFEAGCLAVQNNYEPNPDPEFGEAADDYAASVLSAAPSPTKDL